METRPLYFIAVRHPEAYHSEDDNGKLTLLGEKQADALQKLVYGLRKKIAENESGYPSPRYVRVATFSSVLNRTFQTVEKIALFHRENIIALKCFGKTQPSFEDAQTAFNDISGYHQNEKIIIAVCHGSMPGVLIRAAYEHFVFPIDRDVVPKDIGSNPYYACGYILDTENSSIEKIEVGRKIAKEYSVK